MQPSPTSSTTLIHVYGGDISGSAKLVLSETQGAYASVALTLGGMDITIFPQGDTASTLAAALIEAGEQLALIASELALGAEPKIVALSD